MAPQWTSVPTVRMKFCKYAHFCFILSSFLFQIFILIHLLSRAWTLTLIEKKRNPVSLFHVLSNLAHSTIQYQCITSDISIPMLKLVSTCRYSHMTHIMIPICLSHTTAITQSSSHLWQDQVIVLLWLYWQESRGGLMGAPNLTWFLCVILMIICFKTHF